MSNAFATYEVESNLKSDGYSYVVGVDECGNGAGSGPVVAAACYNDVAGKQRGLAPQMNCNVLNTN